MLTSECIEHSVGGDRDGVVAARRERNHVLVSQVRYHMTPEYSGLGVTETFRFENGARS